MANTEMVTLYLGDTAQKFTKAHAERILERQEKQAPHHQKWTRDKPSKAKQNAPDKSGTTGEAG